MILETLAKMPFSNPLKYSLKKQQTKKQKIMEPNIYLYSMQSK